MTQIFGVDKIEFVPWTNPSNLQAVIKTDLADIFNAELEIISAERKNEAVVISCNQHDTAVDHLGGNLTISCRKIRVLDQNKSELTVEQFNKIAEDYWVKWSSK